MAYAISIITGPGAIVTLTGILNDADMMALDRDLLSLVASDRSLRYVLVDASQLTNSHLSSNQIRNSAVNARNTGINLDLDTTLVFIMPGDLDYGQARLWNGFFAHDGQQAHIYKSREDALAYIDSLELPGR